MDLKERLKKVEEWLESEDGKASIKKMADKMKADSEKRMANKARYDAMTDAEFKAYVIEEETKQDYSYHAETTQEIKNIIDVMLEYGKVIHTQTPTMFEAQRSRYKGLTAILYQGQGSFVRIKSGKKLLLQT